MAVWFHPNSSSGRSYPGNEPHWWLRWEDVDLWTRHVGFKVVKILGPNHSRHSELSGYCDYSCPLAAICLVKSTVSSSGQKIEGVEKKTRQLASWTKLKVWSMKYSKSAPKVFWNACNLASSRGSPFSSTLASYVNPWAKGLRAVDTQKTYQNTANRKNPFLNSGLVTCTAFGFCLHRRACQHQWCHRHRRGYPSYISWNLLVRWLDQNSSIFHN